MLESYARDLGAAGEDLNVLRHGLPPGAFLQIGGNLALLAPLGVLLPLVWTTLRGPIRLALLTGMFSLAIETIQGLLVMGRAFDIDDVILNVAGVVIAYLLLGRRLSKSLRGS